MKHTPEPWIASPFGVITDQNGNAIGSFFDNELLHNDHTADAARAVACVNTLAGVQNPAEFMRTTQEALEGILGRYVSLANSGDAGFWNPEEDMEVIAARKALQPFGKTTTVNQPHNTP